MPLFLLPKENSFIAAYRGQLYHRLNARSQEPAIFCPFLGFRTIDIIKKTLEHTTQLAQMVINQPLKKHFKARFPPLNKPQINEMVSVNCFKTNVRSIGTGAKKCSVFYGTTTGCIDVYKLHEGEDGFLRTYQDFCQEQGVLSILKRDNAKTCAQRK